MNNQEIIDKSKNICCKDKISVSATGLFLQKPFGITFFYSEDGKEWLKTDAAIFAHSRSLADIKRIVELEKALDKIIDRAQQVDGWESFPESWIDEAYEALKEPKP